MALNQEKTLNERVEKKNTELKELKENNQKLELMKKTLVGENETLKELIRKNYTQVANLTKQSSKNDNKKDKETNKNLNKGQLSVLQDDIQKKLLELQKKINLQQQDKFKDNIDSLFNNNKRIQMKVTYIIIKRLMIGEDFLARNKIIESNK